MKMRIINKAGVDLSLLIRSLKHHEDNSKCVVLKVHIFEDRSFILVDYNGIVITKWKGNIDEFIYAPYSTDMEIISIM